MPLGTVLRRQADFYQTYGSGGNRKGLYFAESKISHLNDFKDVSSENTTPKEAWFSDDGLKMYMMGTSGTDRVFQYTCTGGWEPDTASYDSVSKSFTHTNVGAAGMSDDGTKLYTFSYDHPNFKMYTMSTPWDLSTAGSPTDSTLNLGTTLGDIRCRNFHFFDNGSKVLISGGNSDTIYTLELSTPYDITTLSYPGTMDYDHSVDFASGDVYGLAFNFDGTQLIVGLSDDKIRVVDLSTAYDMSTATYNYNSIAGADFSALEPTPLGYWFDGEKGVGVMIGSNKDTVYRMELSTQPSPVSHLQYNSKNKSITAQESQPYCMTFKPDGTKMYISGSSGATIYCYEYDLSTAWDVSTATYNSKFGNIDQGGTSYPTGLAFKSDGTELFVSYQGHTFIESFTLSTPWDISTVSANTTSPSNSAYGTCFGVAIKPDGTKVFMAHFSTNDITEWAMSTPYDLSTATYTRTFIVPTGGGQSVYGIHFDSTGKYMYIITSTDDFAHVWYLATAWDLTSAYYRGQAVYCGSEDGLPRDFFVNPAEDKSFVLGSTNDTVYQYEEI